MVKELWRDAAQYSPTDESTDVTLVKLLLFSWRAKFGSLAHFHKPGYLFLTQDLATLTGILQTGTINSKFGILLSNWHQKNGAQVLVEVGQDSMATIYLYIIIELFIVLTWRQLFNSFILEMICCYPSFDQYWAAVTTVQTAAES